MDILIVGDGGREHTLAWNIRQNPEVHRIYAAPGNAGIAQMATCVPIDAEDLDGLLTAVVSGPVLVPPSQWFAAVWGDVEPQWQGEQQGMAGNLYLIATQRQCLDTMSDETPPFGFDARLRLPSNQMLQGCCRLER